MVSYNEWERDQNRPKTEKKIDWKVLFLVSLVVLIAVELFWVFLRARKSERENYFNAISTSVELPLISGEATEQIEIELNAAPEHSLLTKKALTEFRQDALSRNPEKLAYPYHSSPIFSLISDSAPMVSLASYYLETPPSGFIAGTPASGLEIANPLLLLSAEFTTLSIHGSLKWRKEKLEEIRTIAKVNDRLIPFVPAPIQLQYDTSNRKAQVTYDISLHIEELNNWVEQPLSKESIDFALKSLNAADFGFSYIYLSLPDSKEIEAQEMTSPVLNGVHVGYDDSGCGEGIGCNVEKSRIPSLSNIRISHLPAQAVFYLWQLKPENQTVPADMIYTINFK